MSQPWFLLDRLFLALALVAGGVVVSYTAWIPGDRRW